MKLIKSILLIFSIILLAIPAAAITTERGPTIQYFEPADSTQLARCMHSIGCKQEVLNYYTKPDNVGKNPKTDDLYFADAANVKASPESAMRYFSNKANVEKSMKAKTPGVDAFFGDPKNIESLKKLESAETYFSAEGNLGKSPESSKTFFKREYGPELEVDIEKGSKAIWGPKDGKILNGDSAIDLKSFKGERASISVLNDKTFRIDGNEYKGFANIKLNEDDLIRADEVLIYADGKGSKFTPSRMDLKGATEVESVARSKGDIPAWRVENKGESLSVFLDETKITGMDTPAVSVTQGGVFANKKANAEIQHGPLEGIASGGSLQYRPLSSEELKDISKDAKFSGGYHIGVETASREAKKGYAMPASNPITTGETLQNGDFSNKDVKAAQTMLREIGVTDDRDRQIGADGNFGPLTEQAVKNFQKKYMGIESPTGKIDPVTAEAIYNSYKSAITESAVERVDLAPMSAKGLQSGLSKGMYNNPDVKAAQQMLQGLEITDDRGRRISAYGDFGSLTEQAVKTFQRNHMSMDNPTGVLDAKTLEVLYDQSNTVAKSVGSDGFMKGSMFASRDSELKNPFASLNSPGSNYRSEINLLLKRGVSQDAIDANFGEFRLPSDRKGSPPSNSDAFEKVSGTGTVYASVPLSEKQLRHQKYGYDPPTEATYLRPSNPNPNQIFGNTASGRSPQFGTIAVHTTLFKQLRSKGITEVHIQNHDVPSLSGWYSIVDSGSGPKNMATSEKEKGKWVDLYGGVGLETYVNTIEKHLNGHSTYSYTMYIPKDKKYQPTFSKLRIIIPKDKKYQPTSLNSAS